MPFDARRFLDDYHIQSFPAGHKNVGKDFIGIRCPLCDDLSSHGGFHLTKSKYYCHRCGGHWLPKVISVLTKVNINEAFKIISKYNTNSPILDNRATPSQGSDKIILPATFELTNRASQYLINRKFNPKLLIDKWQIKSTGITGKYKFSIFIPIYFRNQLVAFQCRDITGNRGDLPPYQTSATEESLCNPKHILYGFDQAAPNKKCVVVEGASDSWRMGYGAVATFGISFTQRQILLLARNFDQIFIMYDAEEGAQNQADKMFWLLRTLGKRVEILSLPAHINDPAELSDDEAVVIMKDLGLSNNYI